MPHLPPLFRHRLQNLVQYFKLAVLFVLLAFFSCLTVVHCMYCILVTYMFCLAKMLQNNNSCFLVWGDITDLQNFAS